MNYNTSTRKVLIEKKFKVTPISKEELGEFIKSIGGLENGYGERYWGKSKVRKILFNITNWIIYKIPYFKESKTFSKKSTIRLFFQNISYWILHPVIKDKKPNNPFRSMIMDVGYFSVGKGWYGIIKNLIEESIECGWDKKICQVKEKYGGLRFYINGASEEVHNIIEKYENLSYEICEECGEQGKVRDGSWVSTLCDEHAS
jgi:hypothetical protein